MINLFNRTEYSLKIAFGHLQKVIDVNDKCYAGIVDRHGTFGHVVWQQICKKNNIKPIFGVELAVVDKPLVQDKQGVKFIKLIAKNNNGLKRIYEIVTKATGEGFYYFPRIGFEDLINLPDVLIITAKPIPLDSMINVYLDLNPTTDASSIKWAMDNEIKPIAGSDNYYPRPENREAYEICIGKNADDKTTPMHILDEYEWRHSVHCDDYLKDLALRNAILTAELCTAELPRAELVKPKREATLEEICRNAAKSRDIDLSNPVYDKRLMYELELIKEKDYEDYFYLISDLCLEAKKTMLVGPARGSSCGSLVCYLLGITDIDPIPYGLLFERFIDVNRKDLPDIDIDFPDIKRDQIIEYLRKKYGNDCVAQLGTINQFKAKITIGDVAKELNIPAWEIKDLKEAMIERSGGDSRASFCIIDSFNELDIGRAVLKKYPELAIAGEIEGHARHSGKHAAAIVVTSNPVNIYCSVDQQTGAAMVDKYDAEELNLLKIDALGLRTLTVIEDCLEAIGKDKSCLMKARMDDKMAFDVLNNGKFAGIFQFEGGALQSLCNQMKVNHFEDIVALTALARPGPLVSGMSSEWLQRKTGQKEITAEHPKIGEILKNTYGVVVYQEDIMRITREIGDMSWEDVSQLRKAMSRSMGKEFFDKYKEKFLVGAEKNGFKRDIAEPFWDKINSFGSWCFNRSHAVAYGYVSYWCMILKAHHPLEYSAACLRHSKGDDQIIKLLRELHAEGIKYKPFDKELSKENWTTQDGIIIGGLTGIKGIGEKTAKDIIKRRSEGKKLTPKQEKNLDNATTPYDVIFECKERWGHIFENPLQYGITSPLTELKDIRPADEGEFVFIAKLMVKNQRDKNELINIKKRDGKVMKGQTLYLNCTVEDDTDSIICSISTFKYMKYGKPIVETGKIGDWFIFKGKNIKGMRIISIDRIKKLT